MKKIKLMVDYHCFPTWGIEPPDLIGCFDPNKSIYLKNRLLRWQAKFDSTLNIEDPIESGFENEIEEDLFESEGLSLWRQLRKELLGEYDVLYFSNKLNKLISSPDEY